MSRIAFDHKRGLAYLSKVTLAQDGQKVEVIQSDLAWLKTNLLLGFLLANIKFETSS